MTTTATLTGADSVIVPSSGRYVDRGSVTVFSDAEWTSLSAVQATFFMVGSGSGSATSAGQDTGNTSLASLDTKTHAPPSTGTGTSVANATSNTVLLALNANREGATVFNDDTATTGAVLKVALGFTASATAFTYAIPPQGYYEVPYGYTGAINGIASTATGSARVTELS
jgi:hypothetical protein